jgi:hypothetical protein
MEVQLEQMKSLLGQLYRPVQKGGAEHRFGGSDYLIIMLESLGKVRTVSWGAKIAVLTSSACPCQVGEKGSRRAPSWPATRVSLRQG